jgi:xanthine dehydrogenase small subunit
VITFILNNEQISTVKFSGGSLLDFIRYEENLPGTKIGCREGDCGACTVLMGTVENGMVNYKSIVSCLTPLGNVHGKHIVTIEGINIKNLTPVQKAFIDHSATQCGFCTPGFVMSLTAECLSSKKTTKESAISSVSGNICRCTGYKSIERAAEAITEALKNKNIENPVKWLVDQKHLPEYFLTIPERLGNISGPENDFAGNEMIIGGGTDLMVQKAEELADTEINSFYDRKDIKGIEIKNGILSIGAATTLSEIMISEEIRGFLPGISSYLKLIASESVRNMATVAGNIVNASPIGDFTIILLALNADLLVDDGVGGTRMIGIKDLYEGYKKLRLHKGEFLKSITVYNSPVLFNFEKVSKRTYLDIASVNSAISLCIDGDNISECSLSAGGVSPIPLYLKETSAFLRGRVINPENIRQAAEAMQSEISPISDVRGSEEYKRLLLRQLFFAHFIRLFPEKSGLSTDLI